MAKYYIAYEKTIPFDIKTAKIVYQDEEISNIEEVVEEKGVEVVIYEYDIVPNTEHVDGRMVLYEATLENERLY